MKKILIFWVLGLSLLMAESSPNRQTKEFRSVGELTKALMEFTVLNYPSVKIKEVSDGIRTVESIMEKPYVDVIIRDDLYGDVFISDDLLRYIVMTCNERRVDLFTLLCIIQYENVNGYNPCLDNDARVSHRAIFGRVVWMQHVESLGMMPQYIFMAYRDLPADNFLD